MKVLYLMLLTLSDKRLSRGPQAAKKWTRTQLHISFKMASSILFVHIFKKAA